MIPQRACCLIGVISFMWLSSAVADLSLPDVDLAASRVSPDGDVQSIGAEGAGHLQFDVQSESPGADLHRLPQSALTGRKRPAGAGGAG